MNVLRHGHLYEVTNFLAILQNFTNYSYFHRRNFQRQYFQNGFFIRRLSMQVSAIEYITYNIAI